MRRVHALLAAVIGTALVAGATAFAASDEATAQRQRVAINMVVNDTTDTATFTLHRLTANTLTDQPGEQLDSGTVSRYGAGWSTEYRNGMKVRNVQRHPTLDGKDGTLQLVQTYDTSEMQNGVHVQLGTWRIAKGTGAYTGVKGGGRYVAIQTTNGRTFVRQEGWVTPLR
jgi:hypothetical protein